MFISSPFSCQLMSVCVIHFLAHIATQVLIHRWLHSQVVTYLQNLGSQTCKLVDRQVATQFSIKFRKAV